VKKVTISDEEARERSIGLIELLLSVHRDADFAIPDPDDELLRLILKMLKQQEAEEKDIQEMTFDLHMNYAEELLDDLKDYLKQHRDSYANFRQTSKIMNRAKRVMQRTQVSTCDLKEIIEEMSSERDRLEDDEDGIRDEGFNKFTRYVVLLLGTEITVIAGIFYQTELPLAAKAYGILSGFFFVAYFTWYIFGYVYKRFLITGARKILSKYGLPENR
jgi:hypothetical protein